MIEKGYLKSEDFDFPVEDFSSQFKALNTTSDSFKENKIIQNIGILDFDKISQKKFK